MECHSVLFQNMMYVNKIFVCLCIECFGNVLYSSKHVDASGLLPGLL